MSQTIASAFDALKRAMRDDPEYAWSWHCNLAMPIMDATGIPSELANKAGAHLMSCLFDYDITTHPFYVYEKSDAQGYHEFRLEMDRREDAEIAEGRAS